MSSTALAQADTGQALAEEASTLFAQAAVAKSPVERGRLMYMVRARLERIRRDHANSPIAAQLKFGRYKNVDVALADREGRAWQEAYPRDAMLIGDGGPPVPTFGDRTAAVVPQFQKPPAAPPLAAPSTLRSGVPPAMSSTRLPRSQLVERLRQSVVMVYLPQNQGWGTGFFITPTLVMTNTHVVEHSDEVILINKTLGLLAARVRFRGKTSSDLGIDTAVLEVSNGQSKTFLPLTSHLLEGDQILVAGFTGTSMKMDANAMRMQALLSEGRMPTLDTIPDPRFDFGVIQGIYKDRDSGVENIQTGLTTGGGNSGSPIVNECGQVIGQHYAGNRGQFQVRQGVAVGETTRFSYGISGRELLKFIGSTRLPFTKADDRCD